MAMIRGPIPLLLFFTVLFISQIYFCKELFKVIEYKLHGLQEVHYGAGTALRRSPRGDLQRINRSEIYVMVFYFKTNDSENYKVAHQSFECYCVHHGYTWKPVDMTANETLKTLCPQTNGMFRRHCVAAQLLEELPIKWMIFVGGDIGIINPNRTLEEFVDPNADISFYERMFNWEVMADSYIARNTRYSIDFLRSWANYEWLAPRPSYPPPFGTDNAAIHNVMLDFVHVNMSGKRRWCEKIWPCSRSYTDLFAYEACARELLKGPLSSQSRIKIFPKARGWARDGWMTGTLFSSRDLCFHGWKNENMNIGKGFSHWIYPFQADQFDMALCRTERWYNNFKYNVSLLRSPTFIGKILRKKFEKIDDDYRNIVRRLSGLAKC